MVPGSIPGPRTILRGDSSGKQSPCNLHVMDLWASRLMARHHPCKMGDAGASPARSTNSALSAMGRRPGFQPGKASSSLARAARCRSSSNGESARLRTGRLGDHTLRAAPVYRDRLTGRTRRSERQYRGSNPCPGAISLRSSTAERPRDMREVGRSNRPVGTITRCG